MNLSVASLEESRVLLVVVFLGELSFGEVWDCLTRLFAGNSEKSLRGFGDLLPFTAESRHGLLSNVVHQRHQC